MYKYYNICIDKFIFILVILLTLWNKNNLKSFYYFFLKIFVYYRFLIKSTYESTWNRIARIVEK